MAAYLVVAWIMIEVAETTFPHLGLPPWAVTLVIVLAAAGLPLALVLAWALELTPGGLRRTPAAEEAPGEAAGGGTGRAWIAAAIVLLLVLGAWAAWGTLDPAPDTALEDDVVAVLPFRVAGADPELAYLSEGLVDLLGLTLAGGSAPRTVDTRAALATLEQVQPGGGGAGSEEARESARRLGAGRVVVGQVVGAPDHLTISASVLSTATGETMATAVETGGVDSLRTLVERLTATLLSRQYGEEEHRLRSLATASLPVLRSYLEGQAAYRRAHYDVAMKRYNEALERDSTFAPAALGVLWSMGWLVDPHDSSRARRLAWTHRDRLSDRDQALLRGLLGPRYPAPSSDADRIEAWEQAVVQWPDRAEVWYQLGDQYFHDGEATDAADWRDRARSAFDRALAIDSSWNAPLQHLLDLAYIGGDAEELDRLADLYLTRDSTGSWAQNARLVRRYAAGDSAGVRASLESWLARHDGPYGIGLMSAMGDIWPMIPPEVGARATARGVRNAASRSERRTFELLRRHHALNRGWQDTALAAVRALESLDPESHEPRRLLIGDALYWDGHVEPAEEAARWLHARIGPVPTGGAGPAERSRHRQDACALGQWHAARGPADRAEEMAGRLRQDPARDSAGYRSTGESWEVEACLAAVDALLSGTSGGDDLPRRIQRLEEVLRGGAPLEPDLRAQAGLVLASLLERTGRYDAALAATRSRMLPGYEVYRSTQLREGGRLAAAAGRTDEAVDLYRRYLTLRQAADPALQPHVENVRRALRQLTEPG